MSQINGAGKSVGPGSFVQKIAGDEGTPVSGPIVNILTGGPTAQGTSVFTGDGVNTLTLTYTDGFGNTVLGLNSLVNSSTGDSNNNAGLGAFVFNNATSSSTSVALGANSISGATSVENCTAVGFESLPGANGDGFNDNTAVGYQSLFSCTTGSYNSSVGSSSASNLTSGSYNIFMGYGSGSSYTTSESSNIIIGNAGQVSESHVMRLGTTGTSTGQVSQTYVAGINGVTVSNQLFVVIDSVTEQLGTASVAPTGITTINGDTGFATGSTVNIQTGGPTAQGTSVFTGDDVSTLTLTYTDISSNTVLGMNSLAGGVVDQNYNTGLGANVFQNTSLLQLNVAIGYDSMMNPTQSDYCTAVGAYALQGVSGHTSNYNTAIGYESVMSCTSGVNNTALGARSLLNVASGSSNIVIGYNAGSSYTSSESSNILIGNTGQVSESHVMRLGTTGSSTGQVSSTYIAGINGVTVSSPVMVVMNSSTQQLGTQSIPSAGITTINGDTGSVTGSTITIESGVSTQNSGSSVEFSGSGTILTLDLTDTHNNTLLGNIAGNASISGDNNVGLGYASLNGVSSGGFNSALGSLTLAAVSTGSYNVAVGYTAGEDYSSSESSNIVINNIGTATESNTLRVGSGTGTGNQQLSRAFISGINGVTTANTNIVTINTSTDQLGAVATIAVANGGTGRATLTNHGLLVGAGTSAITQLANATNGQLPIGSTGADPVLSTLTAGTGIVIANGAGSITISASGTTNLTYTNVNTSPYTVLTTDEYISVDCSAGAITLLFPNAATASRAWIVKDRTGSSATHNITVTTVGGAVNIDGSTSLVMNTAYEAINIIGNGSTYEIY